ncbi:MAG: DEAD/DEAH box helicase [Firmicutes bacterium ADurb.Bin193]|nr:MAG: DEAD/DEAH box helicase [Firmicutes bacterium ADurb.Bin193]
MNGNEKDYSKEEMLLREMSELSPITYFDAGNSIRLNCYADTFVYHKASGRERNLVAMRFGGYPEQVRAMADALRGGAGVEAVIEDHNIILVAQHSAYKRAITHDGVYAEGTMLALDDEAGEMQDDNHTEVDNPKAKRKMYIFCNEGDTDSLFAELDKKTAVPLIPEFKDYILDEAMKRNILVPLEVLSASVRFDAYMLEMQNDEKEMEDIVNDGIKTGRISIPKALKNGSFENIESVSQYLNQYGITIADRIRKSFDPLFDPAQEEISDRIKRINGYLKKNVGYSLYPAQLAVAESLKRRLDKAKIGLVVAECGSGKTKIGSVALAAHQGGKKAFNVVLCPSHITKKWVREIEETLPDTKAAVVYSLSDINRVHNEYELGKKTMYAILSKERARDGYMRQPAVVYSKVQKAYLCPHCGRMIEMDLVEDGTHYTVRADQFFFRKETTQNHKCSECGSVLWSAVNPNDRRLCHNKWIKIGGYGFVYRDFAHRHLEKTKDLKVIAKLEEIIANPNQVFIARGAYVRYSMSSYISERFKQIDGVILDELHQFKGDSGQGDAMETLVGCAKKVIGMTATLINGYSSGLFYLLYRIVPYLMKVDNKNYENPSSFNVEYGVTETTYELEESDYNANSRSKKKRTRERQLPGVSPLVYSRFLIDCAVFLSLNDMGKHLPDYEEIPVELELSKEIKTEYERIETSFRSCMNQRDKTAQKLMSSFLSLMTTYPDQPYDHEPIYYPKSDATVIEPKNLSDFDELHEKDVATLDIVERKVKNGERVLIYTSWVKIDTQDKLKKLMEEKGYRVAVLEQRVVPEKREEWVQKQLEKSVDILITNPSLVETGLDLNAFTTLIYYNIGYNLFTFRQSSRRSWRINQTAPRIEVYILYYKGVMQARAIKLMASKLAAATLVEGNFSDEGLAAMSDCTDMTSQLARELTKGITGEVEDVAAIFKRMAIIKDEAADDVDLSEYMIDYDEPASEKTVSVLTVADKLKRAMELAKQANGMKSSQKVQESKIYEYVGNQLTLFDLAG